MAYYISQKNDKKNLFFSEKSQKFVKSQFVENSSFFFKKNFFFKFSNFNFFFAKVLPNVILTNSYLGLIGSILLQFLKKTVTDRQTFFSPWLNLGKGIPFFPGFAGEKIKFRNLALRLRIGIK